jgi:23S rRNA (adenine2503-C2)-methyltransferase
MVRKFLCGLNPDEIASFISSFGGTYNHALKLTNSIYKKGITSFREISNFPKQLIKELESNTSTGVYPPVMSEASSDGTVKYLFVNSQGQYFETVYIPDKSRHTVCVSCQSGCRMGCPFCATAKYGFHGNLSAGDIVNQVTGIPVAGKITHVVFMGMGEPMDNPDDVMKASSILTAEWGKSLGTGNITISSVGITPQILRFLEETEYNISLSLFSPFFDERIKVIPAEKSYPAEEIIGLMKSARAVKRRRLTCSYIMMRGVNDTTKHLEQLKILLSGSGIRVNLLPYHPVKDDEIVPSPDETMRFFKHELVTSGVSASIRKSRGADISAACGLLASGMVK